MRDIRLQTGALLCLFCAIVANAQQPERTTTATLLVPKLVQFSGTFRPTNGMPAQPVEGVTLAVYREQTDGDALWHEIQNVAVDADGHFTVLMGATRNEGMPLELFTTGEPRWLGVQFNRPGEPEQPRVLLVSVPYALKASDADTLGGKPASAYMLAGASVNTGTGADHGAEPLATPQAKPPKARTAATAGMTNYIAKFANTTDLGNSAMYESNGRVGIGTTQPLISLDARTGTYPQMGIGGLTDYLTFFASDIYGPAIYWDPAKDMRFGKGGAGLYNPYGFVEQMRIQSGTGNVGIGTLTPGSKLDVAGDVNFTGSVRYQANTLLQLPFGSGPSGNNIGLGFGALQSNTTGVFNTAIGRNALISNTTGSSNTANGSSALFANIGGSANSATGFLALADNTSGSSNTASGYTALVANTQGNENSASGYEALSQNTIGNYNTAVGARALANNSVGSWNVAIGDDAALLVSGANSNNIHIGSLGSGSDSGTIRIGTPGTQSSFFVAGVRGITTGNNNAIPVLIDSAGQLGTVSSSRRFKEDIQDMGEASRDLMRLRPVTYRYMQAFADGSKPIQYGLIAEEVAEVYPDLVAHSADGQIETVKYQVMDSMLLNEVQRQQAEISALEQQNRMLQERLAKLETALASVVNASRASGVQ